MSGTESPRDDATSVGAAQRAPAPIAVDIGVVAAMGVEVGFLTDRLTKVRKYSGARHSVIEGECAGKLVAIIVAGLGREAARRGAELLIDGHRPLVLFSAGFAGALDPALSRNAIVLADEILDLEGHRHAVDVVTPPDDQTPRARTGKLLTVDHIIRTAAEKAELRSRYGADIVDMESSEVAALCAERSVKLRSVRVVSDEAGVDLAPEIASLMTKTGSYQVGAALRAIWKRPSRLKDFWTLNEHAHEAADRLAAFLVKEFERLG